MVRQAKTTFKLEMCDIILCTYVLYTVALNIFEAQSYIPIILYAILHLLFIYSYIKIGELMDICVKVKNKLDLLLCNVLRVT